jgi:hypothetical protein
MDLKTLLKDMDRYLSDEKNAFAKELRKDIAAYLTQEEVQPVCWVIAVEEYGQMVVYGPQYTARRSAEQDAALPRLRAQKAEVWACYRPFD